MVLKVNLVSNEYNMWYESSTYDISAANERIGTDVLVGMSGLHDVRNSACIEVGKYLDSVMYLWGSDYTHQNNCRISHYYIKVVAAVLEEHNIMLLFNGQPWFLTKAPCQVCERTYYISELDHKRQCSSCAVKIKNCTLCGRSSHNTTSINGEVYCDHCYGALTCFICNTQYMGLISDVNICTDCRTHVNPVPELRHDYKPYKFTRWTFAKRILAKSTDKDLYFGIEIEGIYKGVQEYTNGKIVKPYGSNYLDVLYPKYDSSVITAYCNHNIRSTNTGAFGTEWVIQPHTLDALRARTWKNIMLEGDMRYKADNKDCQLGGHIHISKDMFSVTHLYKFLKFMKTHVALCEFIGGRSIYKSRYFKVGGCNGKILHQVYNKSVNTDRYEMLNITSFNTVEARFFASPETKEELYKNVEFLHALYYWTKDNSFKLTAVDFIKYIDVNSSTYPHMHIFINNIEDKHMQSNDEVYAVGTSEAKRFYDSCNIRPVPDSLDYYPHEDDDDDEDVDEPDYDDNDCDNDW